MRTAPKTPRRKYVPHDQIEISPIRTEYLKPTPKKNLTTSLEPPTGGGEGDTPFFTPRRSPFAPLKEKIKILESSLAKSLKDIEDLKAANEFLTKKNKELEATIENSKEKRESLEPPLAKSSRKPTKRKSVQFNPRRMAAGQSAIPRPKASVNSTKTSTMRESLAKGKVPKK